MNKAVAGSRAPEVTPAPGPGGWPWLAAGLASAVGLLAPAQVERIAPGLFLVGALIAGLLHWTVDLWVPQWATGQRWTTFRPWARFLAGYGLAFGVGLAAWRWARPEATAGFLLLTAWHWGSTDASGTLASGTRRWAALAVGRGLVVVAGPLALRPAAEGRAVLGALAESTPAGADLVALAWPLLGVGVLLEAVVLSLTALDAVAAGERDPDRVWRRAGRHALETLILLALFRCLPALVSTGVYFVFFHACRHADRLEALSPPTGKSAPPRVETSRRKDWLFALVGLAIGLDWFSRFLPVLSSKPDAGYWVISFLIWLSALTLPHAAVVFWWLDRKGR